MCGIPISMLLMQAWFDNEVQKQLDDTEAEINSIKIIDIGLWTRTVNVTVNTSVNNPHDIHVTIIPANLSIEYVNAQLGIISLPEIALEGHSKTVVFNATFHVPEIHWTAYYTFFWDLVDDYEVTVNVSGVLTLEAPALFGTVSSTVEIHKELVLVTDLFLSSTS